MPSEIAKARPEMIVSFFFGSGGAAAFVCKCFLNQSNQNICTFRKVRQNGKVAAYQITASRPGNASCTLTDCTDTYRSMC